VPQAIPNISNKIEQWRDLSYREIAYNVMSLFIDDIPANDLKELVEKSTEKFSHKDITPCVDLDDVFILELFHGPTLAFKDLALQFLGNVFEYILKRDGGELNILGATSGDTGSAAIQGVLNKDNINIFIMHPDGKTSPLQAIQMISVLDDNVFNIAINGTFDDCQHLMKSTFNNLEFKEKHSLGAINSVNWARILAQIVYYVVSSIKNTNSENKYVNYSVPTGNFGDIFAGYIAKKMGCPINKLMLATNENNILAKFFNTGVYEKSEVVHTISPSMDIQIASNFERYLYYKLDQNSTALKKEMESITTNGKIICKKIDGLVDPDFCAGSANTENTLAMIKTTWENKKYLLDPHTATSLVVAKENKTDFKTICLATAHPAKFPSAIKDAIGEDIARHDSLETLKGLPTRCHSLDADLESVQTYISTSLKT
jgi:threonine synthase